MNSRKGRFCHADRGRIIEHGGIALAGPDQISAIRVMKTLTVLTLVLWTLNAGANPEVLEFDNAAQEQRYNTLIDELRCLVCQNQNLADSNADLAKDLRQKTYQMIKDGTPDDEIIGYMVDRYGDFVLYRPPLKLTTLFLWIGPFIILLIGMVSLVRFIRHRRGQALPAPDQQQREQAQRLLHGD